MKVLLDTNILLSIFELKLDILRLIEEEFGQSSYFTVPQVVEEIQKNHSKEAIMVLQILDKIPIVDCESNKPVDNALLDYCVENNCILATQDAELRKNAKSKHLKTLGIRQKKYLYVED